MIGSIVVVALMTVLSILLISGKALNMVPGYRSLPDKVKKTLDPKKVGRSLVSDRYRGYCHGDLFPYCISV